MNDLLLPVSVAALAGALGAREPGWGLAVFGPWLLWMRCRPRPLRGRALALGLLAALAAAAWTGPPPPLLGEPQPAPRRLRMRLERVALVHTDPPPFSARGRWCGRAVGRVLEPGNARPGPRIELLLYAWPGQRMAGETIEVGGTLLPPPRRRNPGDRGPRAMRREGLSGRLVVRNPLLVRPVKPAPALSALLAGWRLAGRRWLAERYPARIGGLAAALLLGARQDLADEHAEQMRQAGVLHFAAVSGLHLGLIALLLWPPLRLIRRPRRRALVSLLALAGYAAISGAGPPVVRALAFAAHLQLGRMLGRPVDLRAAFGCSLLTALVWDPDSTFTLGFRLSYGAVAALLALDGWCGDGRWRRLLGGSLAAWAGSLPTGASAFGTLAPVGILLSPALTPALVLLLGLLLFDAGSLGALPLAGPIAALAGGLLRVADGSGWPLAAGGSPALTAGSWLLAAWLLGRWVGAAREADDWGRRERALAWLGVALLVLIACFPAGVELDPAAGALGCWMLDVGHGQAVLVALPDGSRLLYDAGSMAPDGSARRIERALRALGITRVETLVLSHADADHTGAAVALAARLRIGEVIVGRRTAIDRPELLARLRACGARLRALPAGAHEEQLGGAEASWWVPPQDVASRNQSSLLLRLAWRDRSLLLSGDLEGDALEAASRWVRPAALLQLPHHGNPGGGLAALLVAARPRLAMASNGRPLPRRVGRAVRAAGCALATTRARGALRARWRGGQPEVRGCSDPPAAVSGWRRWRALLGAR